MAETAAESAINQRLEQENARLAGKLVRYKEEAGRRKATAETTTRELAELRTQVTALTAERDKFKTAAEAGPEGVTKELEQLRQEVLAGKHEKAWATVVADKELGLNPGISVARLMKLLDYKVEGEPDPAKIKEALVAQKTGELAFLLTAPQGATSPTPQGATTDPQGLPGGAAAGNTDNGKGGIQPGNAEPGLGAGRTAPQHQPVDEATRLANYHSSKGRVIDPASTKL